MSDDQPRSVLDRVSQWLGRKKTSNPEENGTMPQEKEKKSFPSNNPPSTPEKATHSAAHSNGQPETSPAATSQATEGGKPGSSSGRSPSARRREQRARAKERAAAKAREDKETNGQEAGEPEATGSGKSGRKAESSPDQTGAAAPKTGTAAKSKSRSRGRGKATAQAKAAQAAQAEAEAEEINLASSEAVSDKPGATDEPSVAATTDEAQSQTRSKAKPRARSKAAAKSTAGTAAKSASKAPSKGAAKPPAKSRSKTADQAAGMDDEVKETKGTASSSSYKLLINTDEPEECRLALVENGKVEGFYIESVSGAQCKGNIYKGRITSVEANLQAAFVDIGLPKNGFLSFSEIHPEYYEKEVDPETHWKSLKIQDMIKKGREVLVEVVKEGAGNKGPSLTTYLSLPGRFLVLMPGSDSAGISRKIDDEEQRRKLREMVEGLNIPEGIGYIIRTASQEITKTALTQDMRYLLNLWSEIKKGGQEQHSPALLYKEQNIISRFLRDHYTTDIREILVDNEEASQQVRDFLQLLPAAQRKKTAVKLHQGSQPIFHQYHVEKQIEQMFQPTVPLPSGGSIVINPTEALVAIDVNSGRTASKDRDFEESIFIANMEAAEELARQLRMRDLGGLIVVDFIDMRSAAHTRDVEKKVRECMKKEKAKVDFSRISKFGLMQISRQKMAAPIQTSSYKSCPCCEGRGVIRSVENLALSHLRQLQTGLHRRGTTRVDCRLPQEVAHYILNRKREDLLELEKEYQAEIVIEVDPAMMPAGGTIDFIKS